MFALGRTDAAGGGKLLGTAFGVGSNLLATCHHTIGGDDRNVQLLVPKIGSVNEYQNPSVSQYDTVALELRASDVLRDIAILAPRSLSTSFGFTESLSSADSVSTGSPLQIWGFPHSVDWGRVILTRQDAIVGAKVLLDTSGFQTKHLVINIQSRPGQSGSPVFSVQSSRLVAMLTGSAAPPGLQSGGLSLGGVDPHTLHQTTNAISAEYIKRIIP